MAEFHSKCKYCGNHVSLDDTCNCNEGSIGRVEPFRETSDMGHINMGYRLKYPVALTTSQKVKLQNINNIVFDFDGVFTNNKVYVWEDGSESVRCDRSDGIGLSKLKKMGVEPIILSMEENEVVEYRAEKLGVKYYTGIRDKRKWLEKRQIQGVYVGNDINDIGAMEYMDFSIAVADAYPEVKDVADYVTEKKGGEGAVREVCDLIYNIKKEAEK